MNKLYTDSKIINYDVQYSYSSYTSTNNDWTSKTYVDSQSRTISMIDVLKQYSTNEVLDELDINEIEIYLRKKKIDRIKKEIK